jgi:r-opsin
MSAYSNFNGRWAFGRLGCQLYAMGVGFFGFVSILTFSAIACERCLVIAGPATRPSVGLADGHWKVSRSQAQKVCALIWLHCAILVSMPFFGWSSYVPEGMLTSCSWDYTTRTAANRAYYILLLSTGFLLPLMLICASYGRIMASVVWHARQMVCVNSQSSAFRKLRRQTEIRTAQIVVTLILVYLTAWTPYAIVTLIGQFGPEDSQLSPMATAIPAYFAKTAVVLDPLVYGFSHPHFRASLRNYLSNVCMSRKMKIGSDIRPHRGGNSDGMSKFNSKSWPGGMPNSSYQSRGMTVYPTSACCALRICEPHNCTAATNSAVANQRRMLRTFRELSLQDVQQQETSFNGAKIASSNNSRRPSATNTIGRQKSTQRHQQEDHHHQVFHQVKYKVRNAEFHSECCGPSALVVSTEAHHH